MSVAQRTYRKTRPSQVAGLVSITAVVLAGCSANITRLDAPPSFALGEGASSANTDTRRRVATPQADLAPRAPASYAAPSGGPGNVEVAGLPPLAEPAPQARALAVSRAQTAAAPSPAPAAMPIATNSDKGQQIEVRQGDTLYAIGKRHNVMISDLMSVNDLKSPNLKPGQKLYLPATPRAAALARPQRPMPSPAAEAPAAPQPAPAAGGEVAGGDSYTVKPGDSLFAIAAKHKVKVIDLQKSNNITDARKVKPGMVLQIPAAGSPPADAVASAPPAAPPTGPSVEPRIVRTGGALPPSGSPAAGPNGAPSFKVLNGEGPRQLASASPTVQSDAEATASTPTAPIQAATGKLRWPVKGRIVQGFGPRADGSHNDGVDISVPAGTDVMAAEGGVVAYAGNEVKTYGNLVLIRHDNGWVTAYAYNDKILVGRGDRVKRGQPIAKAGKSGGADQPQLHFEVRVGSKPVDPTGYMEKM